MDKDSWVKKCKEEEVEGHRGRRMDKDSWVKKCREIVVAGQRARGSGGFQILGPWAIFYMRGPACERREQLGVWGRCLGGGLKIFRF